MDARQRVSASHLRACSGFGDVVRQVGDRWGRPSPCPDWDARGVLEHVIGFHDVLLLRPLRAKPDRPKDDPIARWDVTAAAIAMVLEQHTEDVVHVPGGGRDLDLKRLLPMVTTDALVHPWDLARAADVPATLDPELCEWSLDAAQRATGLAASGMFAPPIEGGSQAGVEERLVAHLGRDPGWQP